MTEIEENGVAYLVTGNYPDPPYTKALKTDVPEKPEDEGKQILDKLETLTVTIQELVEASKR